MKHPLLWIILLLSLAASACSPVMASKQPSKKNTALFCTGTPRSDIIAEFGTPTHTEAKDDGRHDIYRFKQGYTDGAKTGRVVMHGVFDVLTLGLWEVVGTPIEAAADGTDMAYEIVYDPEDRVQQVVPLTQQQTGKPTGT